MSPKYQGLYQGSPKQGLILYYGLSKNVNDLQGKGLLKTLWEKEKLLITSTFSFFHNNSYHFEDISLFAHKYDINMQILSISSNQKFYP